MSRRFCRPLWIGSGTAVLADGCGPPDGRHLYTVGINGAFPDEELVIFTLTQSSPDKPVALTSVLSAGRAERIASRWMSDVFVAGGLGDWRAQIRLDPSTGDLEFVDAFQAEPGDFTIDELRPLTFSADGRHAYICVQGFGGGGGIEAYRRDETTGRLTLFAYLQSTNHEFNCADMTMSPTGSWLYTVGRWNDYLVTYQRYHSSGLLLFVNQTRE